MKTGGVVALSVLAVLAVVGLLYFSSRLRRLAGEDAQMMLWARVFRDDPLLKEWLGRLEWTFTPAARRRLLDAITRRTGHLHLISLVDNSGLANAEPVVQHSRAELVNALNQQGRREYESEDAREAAEQLFNVYFPRIPVEGEGGRRRSKRQRADQ